MIWSGKLIPQVAVDSGAASMNQCYGTNSSSLKCFIGASAFYLEYDELVAWNLQLIKASVKKEFV
jgi:hypothetical protein